MLHLLLVLVALCCAAPAGAAAAWAQTQTGSASYSPVATDGERWAVAPGPPGTVLVHDDRDPGWRSLAIDPECSFDGGVGAGRALIVCSSPYRSTFALLDLQTGALEAVPDLIIPGAFVWSGLQPVRLGRRWFELEYSGYHALGIRRYYSLTGGEPVRVGGARRIADLDAPDVGQPLCRPVRRPGFAAADGFSLTPAFEPAQQQGDWVVMRRGLPAPPISRYDVVARRCGTSIRRKLFDNQVARIDVQLGAGVVSDGGASLYRLRDGKRARVSPPDRFWYLQHTQRYLFTFREPRQDVPAAVAVTTSPL